MSITRQLVEEGLCASAHNLTPIRSIYRWKGDLVERTEGYAAVHTRESLVPQIIARLEGDHPYEIPGIWITPITGGNPKYLRWILDATEQA